MTVTNKQNLAGIVKMIVLWHPLAMIYNIIPSLDYGYQALGNESMQRPRQTHELMCMWWLLEAIKDLGSLFLHVVHGLFNDFRSHPGTVNIVQLFQG